MRIAMQYMGMIRGQKCYAPMSDEDAHAIGESEVIVCDMKSDKSKRSSLQNKSIHLYCNQLAEAFNSAGMDMPFVMNNLSKEPCLLWSGDAVKERLWKLVQMQTFGTSSTTKLSTDQVSTIHESINVATSQRLGVSVSFPDRFHGLNNY